MSKFLQAIIRRVIISAITEGQIKRVDAAGLADEQFLDREHFQHYGFTSRPLAGAEGVIIGVGNVFYLIAEDDRRYRIALNEGEVALYTDQGDKLHIKRGGTIDITAATKVTVNAPAVELGDGTLRKLIDERLVEAFNNHTNGGYSVDTPLVLANVATAKTKGS